MTIAIVGAGAVGGFYGALLAAAGHDVRILARGAHLRAIRERGLLVWSPLGDRCLRLPVSDDPTRVGVADLILYAVKGYDNATALPLLPPLCGPQTVVLTLQNGVDSVDLLSACLDRRQVLGGTTYIASAVKAPGLIEHTGAFKRIVFGEVDGGSVPSPRVTKLASAFTAAGIDAEAVADARVPIWEKFIYLAPLAAFTAATRLPTGYTWRDPVIRTQFLAAVGEVEALARAEGIPVAVDVRQRVIDYMHAVSPAMRSSLLIDLAAGRRLELDALQGALVRRAQARGVAVPIMATLHAILLPWLSGSPTGMPTA